MKLFIKIQAGYLEMAQQFRNPTPSQINLIKIYLDHKN